MLHLLDNAEHLTGIGHAAQIAVQRNEQAATGQTNLVIAQTFGMPLERIAALASRDLERLLLIAGRPAWATSTGAASLAATATATGATTLAAA